MKKILLVCFSYTLFIGVLAIAMEKFFNISISFVYFNHNYNMYIFDTNNYIQNLTTNLNVLNGIQLIEFPETVNLNWESVTNSFKSIGNIFISIANWLIASFNILLGAFKLIFYMIVVVMSIVGINTRKINLYDVSITLYTLSIPYIPTISY